MEELDPNEVSEALRDWLGSYGQVEVGRDAPHGRITGWIVHPDFGGISRVTRQQWLWDGFPQNGLLLEWPGLRGMFGERATQIGMILTFSPYEYERAFEEAIPA